MLKHRLSAKIKIAKTQASSTDRFVGKSIFIEKGGQDINTQ